LGAAFEFTSAGLPDFTQPTNSLNDVLNLMSDAADPFAGSLFTTANTIDIYFNVDSNQAGGTFTGGFFVNFGAGGFGSSFDLVSAVQNATISYWLKSTNSEPTARTFNGVHYESLASSAVTLNAVDATVNIIGGFITEFTVAPVPEPNSMILAGIGIAVATWSLRKRRRLGAIC